DPGCGCGGGDPVLSGAGLGDDPLRSETFRQQGLADGVVDLVGAGVAEVFPLEVDVTSPPGPQIGGLREWGGPTHELAELLCQIRNQALVCEERLGCFGESIERRRQCLGHVSTAILAEASGTEPCHLGASTESGARAAAMNSVINELSF